MRKEGITWLGSILCQHPHPIRVVRSIRRWGRRRRRGRNARSSLVSVTSDLSLSPLSSPLIITSIITSIADLTLSPTSLHHVQTLPPSNSNKSARRWILDCSCFCHAMHSPVGCELDVQAACSLQASRRGGGEE